MTPEQMRIITGFASGLGKLKAKQEQRLGCELTPDEVEGIIGAVRTLRAEAETEERP